MFLVKIHPFWLRNWGGGIFLIHAVPVVLPCVCLLVGTLPLDLVDLIAGQVVFGVFLGDISVHLLPERQILRASTVAVRLHRPLLAALAWGPIRRNCNGIHARTPTVTTTITNRAKAIRAILPAPVSSF